MLYFIAIMACAVTAFPRLVPAPAVASASNEMPATLEEAEREGLIDEAKQEGLIPKNPVIVMARHPAKGHPHH